MPDDRHTQVSDSFAEAARFYHHRPAYPATAVQWIADELRLDGGGRMLDVGCGTGHVCLRFAGKFAQIIGIDPSKPMLAEAASIASAGGLAEFEFRRLKAEDLPAGLGMFRLVTFGASFHRVDQVQVTETVYDMLESQGGLALLFPPVPWRGDASWKAALRGKVKEWTGKTLGGPFEPSQNVIARSRFGTCQVRDFQEDHVWSTAQLTGFLLSTSSCSPAILGTGAHEFESDLAAALLHVHPQGRFPDMLETTVVLSRKP
ncbi:MAG TPA: class I SAM-dependent methyltransferase [Phycisphaerae bacterium]|nr:class I SAM-dependent methyltransferase [Phycisphaerae bacterium]